MPAISPSDLFLSPTLTEAEAREYLRGYGLVDPAADEHLQGMAEELPAREALGALAETLLDALSRAADPDGALVAFSRYVATRVPRAAFLRYLQDDPRALALLVDVMGTSPFLSEILIRNPEYFHWLVAQVERPAPEAADLEEEADLLLEKVEGATARGDVLRRFKRREILRIATRDILGKETLESATEQISDLADVVTERALRITERGVLETAEIDRLPGAFVVIGMGKLGGRELNYSSDIDLLFVYEPEDEEEDAQHRLFHKLGRNLVKTMTDFTDESYLYRVDMRLRPMGRRGNIAYSLRQHAQYYDTFGETFERFALLKARAVAGDRDLGARFLALVEPFVYRRYLDHAALEEILRHKLRVEQQQADLDRDVKIGRGGIREIEVFGQVLQLLYGAQNPDLRRASTLQALDALARAGLVEEEARAALAGAYVFLRTLEHRLQIVQEQQTHALSRAERELDVCARRLGLRDRRELEAELERRRTRVHAIFHALFERRRGARDFGSRQWFRVLAEEAPGDEALELLAAHGLQNGPAALEAIRALDQATALAPSRSMARNVLANLLPALLDRVARCARPGQVLMRLEQLTDRTGAAAPFYRTLLENEVLREVLLATLDLGELAATRLVRHPELLDAMLEPLPGADELRARWCEALRAASPEERAREVRRFKSAEELKILIDFAAAGGAADVLPRGGPRDRLHERLSLLAECVVAETAAWCASGAPAGGADEPDWVVIALGKLGGRELVVHSDLDLVILYEGDPSDSDTFMRRQGFAASFERLLEEPTEDGIAYRVDTRLRPEGKKGALAMPFVAFERYLAERAEIWERLAWSRARAIAGSRALEERVARAVQGFVYGPWDARIPAVMSDIRRRMERELAQPADRGGAAVPVSEASPSSRSGRPAWLELKVGRGGLVDIDFALQMIQIREGGERPELRVTGTRELLDRLEDIELLSPGEVSDLRESYAFLRRLELFARMDADAPVSAWPTDPERLEPVARRMGLSEPAGEALLERFAAVTQRVRAIHDAVLARLDQAG